MGPELEPVAVRDAAEEELRTADLETAGVVSRAFTGSLVGQAIEVASPQQPPPPPPQPPQQQ